jgi:hypothetical protein
LLLKNKIINYFNDDLEIIEFINRNYNCKHLEIYEFCDFDINNFEYKSLNDGKYFARADKYSFALFEKKTVIQKGIFYNTSKHFIKNIYFLNIIKIDDKIYNQEICDIDESKDLMNDLEFSKLFKKTQYIYDNKSKNIIVSNDEKLRTDKMKTIVTEMLNNNIIQKTNLFIYSENNNSIFTKIIYKKNILNNYHDIKNLLNDTFIIIDIPDKPKKLKKLLKDSIIREYLKNNGFIMTSKNNISICPKLNHKINHILL